MKAAIAPRYGGPEVVRIAEVERPVPQPGEILIRVRASTVSSGDIRMREFLVPPVFWLPFRFELGLLRPKNPVLGVEFSGDVVETGAGVTEFRVGDAVFGYRSHGCHAEFKVMPARGCVAPIPPGLGYEAAAAVPHGELAALYFLHKAGISAGQQVLVNGASGAVGTMAVQIAKALGAEVTGVCGATHLELVRSLGADRVIDYGQEDFTRGAVRYDIVLDTVSRVRFRDCRRVLTPSGVHVVLMPSLARMFLWGWTALRKGPRLIAGVAPEEPAMLMELSEMIERGAIRPVIDRRYPLDRIAEAHAYVDQGHKAGNVVITIAGG